MIHHPYYEAVLLVERLHRHFLEVVKLDLDRKGVQDINNVQALILYNLGDDELTVGELTTRGYYLGSNVSYNVKKMTEAGYLQKRPSPHDKRSERVSLTDKGKQLRKAMHTVFEQQVQWLGKGGIVNDDLGKLNETLRKLERFWTSLLNYGAVSG